MSGYFDPPKQLLEKEAYISNAWFEEEKSGLFDQSWVFACTIGQLENPGDFVTTRCMHHPLVVLMDANGKLEAFHNICRHRGCEVLEDQGNTGKNIVCPYHRWTYRLDGALGSVTNEAECFEGVNLVELSLHKASVGVYRGLVFVNPTAGLSDSFPEWIANMDDHAWPHDLSMLEFKGNVTYEMHCNWKIFYENAIDGYHLGYLHDKTLGKVYPDKNVWEPVGRHVVWYSTERDGKRQSNTLLTEQMTKSHGAKRIPGTQEANFPGVVMLFPLTILSPSPWGFYISILEPVSPHLTNMKTLSFAPPDSPGRFVANADSKRDEIIRLKDIDCHPLESGNFQIEDMWIVEKIQRNITSPHYKVGPLAGGEGAEGPLSHFQKSVLEFMHQ